MCPSVCAAPHPALAELLALLGRWEGDGRGTLGQTTFAWHEVLERSYEVRDGRLHYRLAMGLDGAAALPHLTAELTRSEPGPG